MKIILVTPLYPPDIAEPSSYVKELASRLKTEHEITILTYGKLPEKIPGVKIVAIDKSLPAIIRLFLYTLALFKALFWGDVVYAQNGPSVELPLGFVMLFVRKHFIFHLGDTTAHTYAQTHPWRLHLEKFVSSKADAVFTDHPLKRPEILPLESYPETEMREYQASWEKHLEKFSNILTYA